MPIRREERLRQFIEQERARLADLPIEPVAGVDPLPVGEGLEAQIRQAPVNRFVFDAANWEDDVGLRLFDEKDMEKKSEVGINPEMLVPLNNGGNAKAKDCVRTNCGRWFKKGDKDVVEDYYSKEHCYIGSATGVVVTYDNEGLPLSNKLAYSYFKNVKENCAYISWMVGSTQTASYADLELLPKDKYNECFIDSNFYHKAMKMPKAMKYPKYRKVDAIKKSYDDEPLSLTDQYKFGIKSPSYNRTEGKKYSFGVELETIRGYLPYYVDKDLNYEAVHDGSLRDGENEILGAEYVTGVLVGDTGLQQLKRLTNELTKRCKVDKKCGMHIHLGDFDLSKQSIVLLYKLLLMVENEMFSMLPPSRRKNEYCRELKKINLKFTENDLTGYNYKILIEKYYSDIVRFVSGTEEPSDIVNRKKEHPMGHKCGYNHASSRYCWVNLVPTLFNTRGNGVYTVEFRSHSGTTSYEKIKMWLLICMGLLWFVENYGKEIALLENISLKEIINRAYPKHRDKINAYIDLRFKKFNCESAAMNSHMEELDYDEIVTDASLSIKRL